MYQYEAVIEVMKRKGGYATLAYLYQNALKIEGCEWKTKTPYASIRRIVQDDRFFFRIKPGLWALKSHQDQVLQHFGLTEDSPKHREQELDHSYYQGLLVEIGNFKGFKTFVPYQDKNRLYLNLPLSNYATLDTFYKFTYEHVVRRAITVDVTWFNSRMYPQSFFEIEHTTDIQNSLLKFVELQDFYVEFFIVGDISRRKEFDAKLSYSAFEAISERVKFIDYVYLSRLHARSAELYELQHGGVL